MNVFVDFVSLTKGLTPYFLRKLRALDFVASLIKPLQQINQKFVTFRNDTIFFLSFNAQVIYLEKYLNLIYNVTATYPNNIFITDSANVDFNYYYNKSENQVPKYLYNESEPNFVYLRNSSEENAGASYRVNVPTSVIGSVDIYGVNFDEFILINRIKQYNNAGKTFDIVYF